MNRHFVVVFVVLSALAQASFAAPVKQAYIDAHRNVHVINHDGRRSHITRDGRASKLTIALTISPLRGLSWAIHTRQAVKNPVAVNC